NIERGRQPIQLHQLYLFASILQVDVTKLLPKETLLAEIAVQPDDKQARYLAEATKILSRADKRTVGGDHGRSNQCNCGRPTAAIRCSPTARSGGQDREEAESIACTAACG